MCIPKKADETGLISSEEERGSSGYLPEELTGSASVDLFFIIFFQEPPSPLLVSETEPSSIIHFLLSSSAYKNFIEGNKRLIRYLLYYNLKLFYNEVNVYNENGMK